jgi:hypothetical protein
MARGKYPKGKNHKIVIGGTIEKISGTVARNETITRVRRCS